MKQIKISFFIAVFLFVIFTRSGVAQSPVISKSTCDVGNLTIKERDPHDGRLVFVFSQTAPNGLPKTNFRTIDQVNQYFGASAITELEAIDAICTPTRSLTEIVTFLQDTSGSSGTFTATPQTGGNITLADGTQLAIPAGAVAQNTDITVETQGSAGKNSADHAAMLYLAGSVNLANASRISLSLITATSNLGPVIPVSSPMVCARLFA